MNELGMSCLAFVACDKSDEIHPLNQIMCLSQIKYSLFIPHSLVCQGTQRKKEVKKVNLQEEAMWPIVRVKHLHTDVPCTNPAVDHRQYCFIVLNPPRIVNNQLIASLLVGCLNLVIFISIVSLYTPPLKQSAEVYTQDIIYK